MVGILFVPSLTSLYNFTEIWTIAFLFCFISPTTLRECVKSSMADIIFLSEFVCVMQFIMQYFFFLRLKQRELVCQLVGDQQSLTSNEETQSTRIFPKVKKNLFDTHVDFVAGVFLVKRWRNFYVGIGFSLLRSLCFNDCNNYFSFLRNHVTVCRLIVGS